MVASLIFASAGISAETTKVDYETFIPDRPETDTLYLPIRLTKGQRIYRRSVLAVRIDQVTCDSKKLSVSDNTRDAGDGSDFSEIEPDADVWLYKISVKRLSFAMRLDPPLVPFVIAYYDIPKTWSALEIVYRIEFPNGNFSVPQTIRLRRYTE